MLSLLFTIMTGRSFIQHILANIESKDPHEQLKQSRTEHYCGYNPMSVIRPGRKTAIIRELSHCSVLAMYGTRDKQLTNTPISQSQTEKHLSITCGYPNKGNKHTGVSLHFSTKTHNEKHIHSFAYPEDKSIQGRVMAVRARRPDSDLCHIPVYFPTISTYGAIKITKKILAWIGNLFESLPLRCIPYLYFDLNSGVGLEKVEGIESVVDSEVVGKHNLATQNKIGELVHKFLAKWRMTLPMTFAKHEPTYYSVANACTSHIDHIAIPESVWNEEALEHKTAVLIRSGRKLQLVKSIYLADHMPVMLSHKRSIYVVAAHNHTPKVDRDALMRCLLYGYKRGTLVKCIEQKSIERKQEFEKADKLHSPSRIYNHMIGVLHDSMVQTFPHEEHKLDPELQNMKKQRNELIDKRKNANQVTFVKERQNGRYAPREILMQWRNTILIDKFDRQIKEQNKRIDTTKTQMYVDEINLSSKRKDSASTWRAGRRLAAACKGSRRVFAHSPMPRPTVKESLEQYQLPAKVGGWGAVEVGELDHLEPCFEHIDVVEDLNTDKFIERFTKAMHRSSCRKAFPPGDIPYELWRIVLLPQWLMPGYSPKWGLGSDRIFPTADSACKMFRRFVATIHCTKCLAVANVVNTCFTIPKKITPCIQFKKAVQATRSIHCYSGFTQILLRTYKNTCFKKLPPADSFAFGAVRFRQREEAIAVQLHIMHRAHKCGVNVLTQLYDLTNAFYCVEFEMLEEFFDLFSSTHKSFGKIAFSDIIQNNISIVPCSDGVNLLSAGTGVMPGLSEATRLFNFAYSKPLNKFLDVAQNQMWLTNVLSPVSKKWIQAGMTAFVDDVATSLCTFSHQDMPKVAKQTLKLFDQSITPAGFKQNMTKANSLLLLHGEGSRTTFNLMKQIDGINVCAHARYLGPQIHWLGRAKIEVCNRVKQAWSAFYMYRKLWYSNVNIKFKICVFRSTVCSVLFSALVVFVFTKAEFGKISVCYYGMLRKPLRGEACAKTYIEDKVHKHKSITNSMCCRKLNLCSVATELRVRRLTFLQNMIRHPEAHELYLSTLFGQFAFENCLPEREHNPWILQYHNDLHACAELDDMIFVCQNVGPTLIELLENEDVKNQFLMFDTSTLRAQELTYNTCYSKVVENSDQAVCERCISDEVHVCEFVDTQGYVCNKKFDTHRKLVMHQKHSATHFGSTIHLRQFVPTNQCLFCETTFASHMCAYNHVRNALNHGRCAVNRSYLPVPLVEMQDLSCPVCVDLQLPTLSKYYVHVTRQHLCSPSIATEATQKSLHKSHHGLVRRRRNPSTGGQGDEGRFSRSRIWSGSRRRSGRAAGKEAENSFRAQVRGRAKTHEGFSNHFEQAYNEERASGQDIQEHFDRGRGGLDRKFVGDGAQGGHSRIHGRSEKNEGSREKQQAGQSSIGHPRCPRVQQMGQEVYPREEARLGAYEGSDSAVGNSGRVANCSKPHQALQDFEDVSFDLEANRSVVPPCTHAGDPPSGDLHIRSEATSRAFEPQLGLGANSRSDEEGAKLQCIGRNRPDGRPRAKSSAVFRFVREGLGGKSEQEKLAEQDRNAVTTITTPSVGGEMSDNTITSTCIIPEVGGDRDYHAHDTGVKAIKLFGANPTVGTDSMSEIARSNEYVQDSESTAMYRDAFEEAPISVIRTSCIKLGLDSSGHRDSLVDRLIEHRRLYIANRSSGTDKFESSVSSDAEQDIHFANIDPHNDFKSCDISNSQEQQHYHQPVDAFEKNEVDDRSATVSVTDQQVDVNEEKDRWIKYFANVKRREDQRVNMNMQVEKYHFQNLLDRFVTAHVELSHDIPFLFVLEKLGMCLEPNSQHSAALDEVVGVSEFPSQLLFEKIFVDKPLNPPAPLRPRQLRKLNSEQAILAAFDESCNGSSNLHDVSDVSQVEMGSSSSSQSRELVVLSRPIKPETKMLKRLNSEQALAEYIRE